MGCTSNDAESTLNPSRKARKAVGATVEPASRTLDYEIFSAEIRQELDSTGPLERLLADHVIQAAWQLKQAIERRANRQVDETTPADRKTRIRPTVVETAARAVREAFEIFEAARAIRNSRSSSGFLVELRSEPEIEPNEWPVVPSAEQGGESLVDDEEFIHWRDRLTFDFEVSDISPVVKGTWVTVGHVVSLIVDGWTWADILRSHPELSEDDIRACVTYAMDQENANG